MSFLHILLAKKNFDDELSIQNMCGFIQPITDFEDKLFTQVRTCCYIQN